MITTASAFEHAADDYIKAITTPDTGNGEAETAMQAFASKYELKTRNGDSVLAALLRTAADGTLRARVRAVIA